MEHPVMAPKTLKSTKRSRQSRKKKRAANRRKNSQSSLPSLESQNHNNPTNFFNTTYNGIISWQYQHQIAYWKSKAIALTYENKVLHTIIRDIYSNKGSQTLHTKKPHTVPRNQSPDVEEHNDDDEDEEEFSFVLSDEMKAFLVKSAEHRLKRDQEKKLLRDSIEAEKSAPPDESSDSKRLKDMKAIYGPCAEKIICLETSMQLNFDQYIDANNPVHWPNIPLVL